MVRRGEMTAEAVTRLKFRSLLEQAMGGDGAPISPQVIENEWEPGDAYALCCDGLYGPLGDQTEPALREAMVDPSVDAAGKLINAANAAGGPDNITVILVRLMAE
jgi:serine/threonine protein phosphatase PrpC